MNFCCVARLPSPLNDRNGMPVSTNRKWINFVSQIMTRGIMTQGVECKLSTRRIRAALGEIRYGLWFSAATPMIHCSSYTVESSMSRKYFQTTHHCTFQTKQLRAPVNWHLQKGDSHINISIGLEWSDVLLTVATCIAYILLKVSPLQAPTPL